MATREPANRPVSHSRVETVLHTGPLPDPRALEDYEATHPGTAERIVRAFEAESEHRRHQERQIIEAQIVDARADRAEARRGQWFAFAIGALALTGATICAVAGQPWAAAAIGGTSVPAMVYVFVKGRLSKQPESTPTS